MDYETVRRRTDGARLRADSHQRVARHAAVCGSGRPGHRTAGRPGGDSPAPRLWRAVPSGPTSGWKRQPRFAENVAYPAERGAARDGKPFFLYLAFAAPHTPTLPTKAFAGKTPTPYGDFVLQIDADVGAILAALEQNGLAPNTLVIFTTDNGYAPAGDIPRHRDLGHDSTGGFRGSKSDSFEGGHRVPFIVRWPGVTRAGSRCAEVIGHLDVFATCAEILGTKLPDTAAEDSSSLLALLRGGTRRRVAKPWCIIPPMGNSRSPGEWKLILAPGSGGWSPPTRNPSPWTQPKADSFDGLPPFQLYDLAADPKETTNLAGRHPEIVQRLGKLMRSTVERGRSTPGASQPYVREGWPQTAWMKNFIP